MADSRLAESQRAREIGGVPEVGVNVRQHAPKSVKLGGGDAHAELGKVTFQKGLHELVAPADAIRLAARQVCRREPATAPVAPESAVSKFVQTKSCQLDRLDSAGERLR